MIIKRKKDNISNNSNIGVYYYKKKEPGVFSIKDIRFGSYIKLKIFSKSLKDYTYINVYVDLIYDINNLPDVMRPFSEGDFSFKYKGERYISTCDMIQEIIEY